MSWTPELYRKLDNDHDLHMRLEEVRRLHRDDPSDPHHLKFAAAVCKTILDAGYPALTSPAEVDDGRMCFSKDGDMVPMPRAWVLPAFEKMAEELGFTGPDWRDRLMEHLLTGAKRKD